jgi:transcription antitermination factor NusG
MTLWAAYTRREFDAAEECEALGITAYAPRKVDVRRSGKKRRAEAVEGPAWPGYIFIEATADEWHMLKACKHIRTLMGIGPKEAEMVRALIKQVEAEFDKRMAQIAAGERVSEYRPGELLEIVLGPFAGQLARFKRIAEGAIFPEVVAEADIMGQSVTIRLDPLAAKKAVA